MTHAQSENSDPVDFPAFADSLMAAGDRLADKLRELDDSPWAEQILEEWSTAKDITQWLP